MPGDSGYSLAMGILKKIATATVAQKVWAMARQRMNGRSLPRRRART